MARNRDKHAYFTVGLPRESEALRALKADADERGISIPQLIAVRIADWYAFATRATVTVPTQHADALQPEQSAQAGASSRDASTALFPALQSRASAAAAAWGDDED